jgi:hypothetical protein
MSPVGLLVSNLILYIYINNINYLLWLSNLSFDLA